MPDRAVVDECSLGDAPGEFGACTCNRERPQPRALSAVSEDRQWLVVRCREGTGYDLMFAVLICRGGDYEVFSHVKDTGQDAHEVLAAWMEERGG